mmetsp:Transcript_57439/g.146078  ORF Transcript_57439/g.146078 Transcript_57439/m.146078 type:complete len:284 (-) Transcript_57439:520-1371(-)
MAFGLKVYLVALCLLLGLLVVPALRPPREQQRQQRRRRRHRRAQAEHRDGGARAAGAAAVHRVGHIDACRGAQRGGCGDGRADAQGSREEARDMLRRRDIRAILRDATPSATEAHEREEREGAEDCAGEHGVACRVHLPALTLKCADKLHGGFHVSGQRAHCMDLCNPWQKHGLLRSADHGRGPGVELLCKWRDRCTRRRRCIVLEDLSPKPIRPRRLRRLGDPVVRARHRADGSPSWLRGWCRSHWRRGRGWGLHGGTLRRDRALRHHPDRAVPVRHAVALP